MRVRLIVLLLLVLPFSAQATNFVVSTIADTGAGSLRQAIIGSNSPAGGVHTVSFAVMFPNEGVIVLNSNLPQILSQSLMVRGDSKQPRIDGQHQYALFRAGAATTVLELSDLTLQNALASEHGACVNSGSGASIARLRVERVTFSNCKAVGPSLIRGGAVFWSRSAGSVSVVDSRFVNNSVVATATSGESSGGALYANADLVAIRTLFDGNGASSTHGGGGLGGAITLAGSHHFSSIADSTFLGNGASPGSTLFGYGGGIYIGCDACSMQILRSYLRGNSANMGGAVLARKVSTGTTDVYLTVVNSTFYNNSVVNTGAAVYVGNKTSLSASNNTFYNGDAVAGAHLSFGSTAEVSWFRANLLAPTVLGSICSGTPTVTNPGFVGFNLFSDASCSTLAAGALPNSPLGIISVDEQPGLVGVLRFSGSAVIDSITAASLCEPLDARSRSRPLDGDDDGVAYCDVGAYEEPGDLIFRDDFEV